MDAAKVASGRGVSTLSSVIAIASNPIAPCRNLEGRHPQACTLAIKDRRHIRYLALVQPLSALWTILRKPINTPERAALEQTKAEPHNPPLLRL